MWSMYTLKMMSNINNYIVVGGTSGIGLATANYLKDIGNNVIVGSRKETDACSHKYIPVDVTSDFSVKEFYKIIESTENAIDGFVYSVGITTKKKSIREFDVDVWREIIDVNVTGLLRLLKVFYPLLSHYSSRVVIVNSIAARKYSDYSSFEYTASKCALSGIVRQLAIEWKEERIMINSVFPSMTLTPMLNQQLGGDKVSELSKTLPLRKLAPTLDTARAIEFLLNPNNQYITGSGIDISGGLYLNG
jgi:2-dehydro-3-deoxy-D-gluconate 5-dehydrogenase